MLNTFCVDRVRARHGTVDQATYRQQVGRQENRRQIRDLHFYEKPMTNRKSR